MAKRLKSSEMIETTSQTQQNKQTEENNSDKIKHPWFKSRRVKA